MLYEGTGTIQAFIRKEGNHHVTDIMFDGKVVKTVPTDPSQIRPEESLLWKPDLKKSETTSRKMKDALIV